MSKGRPRVEGCSPFRYNAKEEARKQKLQGEKNSLNDGPRRVILKLIERSFLMFPQFPAWVNLNVFSAEPPKDISRPYQDQWLLNYLMNEHPSLFIDTWLEHGNSDVHFLGDDLAISADSVAIAHEHGVTLSFSKRLTGKQPDSAFMDVPTLCHGILFLYPGTIWGYKKGISQEEHDVLQNKLWDEKKFFTGQFP